MPDTSTDTMLFGQNKAAWQDRLTSIVELMRDMSRLTDPQQMVRAYGARVSKLSPVDLRLSLSRRGLSRPSYRITRSTAWKEEINPWTQRDRLPQFSGGLLAELLYSDEPRMIDDLVLEEDEPALELLSGYRSLIAVPQFDQGTALNMVVSLCKQPGAFSREDFPEIVWMTNLFGRFTNSLVLASQLQQAYQDLDREFKAVGEIQRALLPSRLPQIPTLDLAAYYQPSRRAGGDYYDFFPLPDGKWGIFIGDVSGHGTPAAVLMAVTHGIAHTHPGPPQPPAQMLDYLNRHLVERYTGDSASFITAFYGIYDPAERTLAYARAGHPAPRVKRCWDGTLLQLDEAGGLPLGIDEDAVYDEALAQLQPGDQVVFYTDGITEAANPRNEQFGAERLDGEVCHCSLQATALLDSVLKAVDLFSDGRPADDDRTMIVARVL